VHLAQGRFELADEHFKTALQLKPPVQVVMNYHVERARGLLRRDLHEDALRACDAARTLAPNLPTPHLARGHALLALGRHASAEESFDQYLRLGGPETPDLFRGRGAARMQLGRYPEAAEDYTRVLERAPDAEMYQHRGWAHFFADAWKLALRDFTQAIERDAEASDSYTGRGLAYVMLGDYQNAVRDAEDTLRRHPDTPEMMHNVACIFAQAAARVDADKSVVERLMLAANYRHRALDALRRTLQMVDAPERPAFWRDKVLPDAALAPIRAESAFAQLQAEYSRGLVSGTGKK
jgi:tetratricopeptide (TPR) repeat protein